METWVQEGAQAGRKQGGSKEGWILQIPSCSQSALPQSEAGPLRESLARLTSCSLFRGPSKSKSMQAAMTMVQAQ